MLLVVGETYGELCGTLGALGLGQARRSVDADRTSTCAGTHGRGGGDLLAIDEDLVGLFRGAAAAAARAEGELIAAGPGCTAKCWAVAITL